MLVADGVSLEQAGRLAAILAQGPRLGVGALLPGTAVDGGAQLVLDDTGRVQTATPWELGDQQLVGARACSLTQLRPPSCSRCWPAPEPTTPTSAESSNPPQTPRTPAASSRPWPHPAAEPTTVSG